MKKYLLTSLSIAILSAVCMVFLVQDYTDQSVNASTVVFDSNYNHALCEDGDGLVLGVDQEVITLSKDSIDTILFEHLILIKQHYSKATKLYEAEVVFKVPWSRLKRQII